MNWKQLAKAVVDEVQKWANERFADLEKVKALIAAESRELRDAHRASAGITAELQKQMRELAARPAPTATVDGAMITAAVSGWFEKNPPPIPKDGTSVDIEDLQPFLQAGLAKWQLEFERQASGVLQRFLDKLRQPVDGKPGKDASPEQIRAAVDAFMAEHPLPTLDADAITAATVELARTGLAKWLAEHPPAAGERGPAPTAEAIAAAVREHLEKHPIPAGKDGAPGAAATAADVEAAVARYLEAHPIPPGKDGAPGKDGERGADGAAGRDGVDGAPGKDGAPGRDGVDGKDGAPGKDGERGADGAPGEAGPRGERGEPGAPGKDGEAGLRGEKGERGDVGPAGRDGVDGKDGIQGPAGRDGAAGKDGAPGKDGRSVTLEEVAPLFAKAFAEWALDFERRAADVLARAIDKLEKPKDGRDGLNVENFSAELGDDGRTLRLVLADGERRHTATLKLVGIPLDRGVFKDGATYERGDGVTFGGSWWIAQKDEPKGRPGQTGDWRLAVKHGRDAPKPTPR